MSCSNVVVLRYNNSLYPQHGEVFEEKMLFTFMVVRVCSFRKMSRTKVVVEKDRMVVQLDVPPISLTPRILTTC